MKQNKIRQLKNAMIRQHDRRKGYQEASLPWSFSPPAPTIEITAVPTTLAVFGVSTLETGSY